jgi:hypothetical protein
MGVQKRDKYAKTVEIHLLCSDGGTINERELSAKH